jgi:hypothetical protein
MMATPPNSNITAKLYYRLVSGRSELFQGLPVVGQCRLIKSHHYFIICNTSHPLGGECQGTCTVRPCESLSRGSLATTTVISKYNKAAINKDKTTSREGIDGSAK